MTDGTAAVKGRYEIDKANSTLVLIKSIDLRPLDANHFTKAWLESKSR